MKAHLIYLLTTLFFAGAGNLRIWMRHGKFLKRHWQYIFYFVLLTLPITSFEYFARRWGAWNYHADHVLNYHLFGAEIETYLFMALVAAALMGATLAYSHLEDEARKKKRSRRRVSTQQRKLIPTAASSRR